MIRWPERFKWIEGRKSKVKYVQGFVRKFASLAENVFIRLAPLPVPGVNKKENLNKKIIVSLTSFPPRINQVYYAIKSLMLQSMVADKIILWLAAEQFPDFQIPEPLEKLKRLGLEIRFTEDDLKSHKKYYYALQEQKPDELIITFDDDLIYEPKAIERLVKLYQRYPDKIIVNRGLAVTYSPEKGVDRSDPSRLYSDVGVNSPSFLVIPSTGAGCLYPYGLMPSSTFIKEDILNLAPSADDIWIWYNSLKGKVGVVKTKKISRALCEVTGSQKICLDRINDAGGENDRVLSRLDYRNTPLTDPE
ncbi:MAG: hypothetical protein J1F16_04870 [Muribaculaceae bacterium]|nr:hypothetical protein [Muribaculaceae bacterium]